MNLSCAAPLGPSPWSLGLSIAKMRDVHAWAKGVSVHRFVIFGRGRSGTTVVTDELGMHPQIAVPIDVYHHEGLYWNLLEPFAAQTLAGVSEASTELRQGEVPLPYDPWCVAHGSESGTASYAAYLGELEAWAERRPAVRAGGFKIIDNQMLARVGLIDVLHERGYRIVNVHRRNVIRQALSGLLARARGVFNAKNYEVPDATYEVDPAAFLAEIKWILQWTRTWDQQIAQRGMRSVDVEYEVFLADREAFYGPIFELLEVDPLLPAASEFTRMTPKDLSSTIRNYAQIAALAAELGLEADLVEP